MCGIVDCVVGIFKLEIFVVSWFCVEDFFELCYVEGVVGRVKSFVGFVVCKVFNVSVI